MPSPGERGFLTRLPKRDGLQELIADVQRGYADFGSILVYDVSRWGRFQDVDESAYYEFICKRAGIQVHYAPRHLTLARTISGGQIPETHEMAALGKLEELPIVI